MKSNRFLSLILFLFLSLANYSQTLRGKVIGITDGDTFKLLIQDSTVIKIRLANIDCPEKKQPFSKNAKDFTSNAIFGKTVCLEVIKRDRYKRYIANVFYNDSLNLSYQLLKNGLAWHYIKYSEDINLQKMEDMARRSKLGLWIDPKSIPPWEWRDNKKKKQQK